MHLVMKCHAIKLELQREKIFEECRLKYSKVLGPEWGEEAKQKAAAVQARRERGAEIQSTGIKSLISKARELDSSKKDKDYVINTEKALPKLPVPSLTQTLDTYLKVLKPITSSKEYEEAVYLVSQFNCNDAMGPRLQRLLLERTDVSENWAYDWWLRDMYLYNKAPLPINSNPGMVFPLAKFSGKDEQLKFAARLVSGILDYKIIIDARGLPIDRANHREKGQPLCMEQYYRLFSSYREPGIERDKLLVTEEVGSESDHIIVCYRNRIFILHVVDGIHRLTEDDICCQLRRIVDMCRDHDESEGLGILTTMPRDKWAAVRHELLRDEVNARSLSYIEKSIFILCLDQPGMSETFDTRDKLSIALQMLHGQGTDLNSCNRWYDKTMQFVVGEDGACGLNYEHSPSEGIAVVQLIEHVLRYMDDLKTRKLVRMDSNSELPYPDKVDWNITNNIIQHTDMARFHMDRAIADLDLCIMKFDNFGKEFPKSQNMSPDCFIQLALQLTFYRIHGRLVSTYESASTRRFRLGRVDNIRAASTEALEWCQAMDDDTVSVETRLSLLRKALIAQTDYMVQTILGHGMDCHMLGLKQISEELENTTPDLFKHSTWNICNNFTLSTSQVNTTLDSFMCYGPVAPDGYGVSYNPHPNYIRFCVSSFKSCVHTNSRQFGETLESVLIEMRETCLKVNKSVEDNRLEAIKEYSSNVNNVHLRRVQ